MKRALFQNITAIPYTPGDVIDRTGFLSAVIGANVSAGGTMTVKVEHSDDGETFVSVTDEMVFPETRTKGGEFTFKDPGPVDAEGVEVDGGIVNVDVDLAGLKNFIKFTVEGSDSLVVVLGDSTEQPV